jgi:hypothetical protein
MFCPQCRSEYREGFTRCADCDVDLVPELPRDVQRENVELVKVYESGDGSIIPLIESLLEDAGIEFEVTNASRQYPTTSQLGFAEFWVRAEDEAEARAVLEELEGSRDGA